MLWQTTKAHGLFGPPSVLIPQGFRFENPAAEQKIWIAQDVEHRSVEMATPNNAKRSTPDCDQSYSHGPQKGGQDKALGRS